MRVCSIERRGNSQEEDVEVSEHLLTARRSGIERWAAVPVVRRKAKQAEQHPCKECTYIVPHGGIISILPVVKPTGRS
jgi:hypothetical protein